MITLHIASMPERARMLRVSLASLLPQVDVANVMLSGFTPTYIPDFLRHDKIRVFHHDNRLEDGSRFLFVDRNEDYTVVCDDDIEYPPNFVQYLLTKHKHHGGIVGIMGKVLKPRPIQSYYKDETIHYKAFEAVIEDVSVEVLGMCGVLFHQSIGLSAEYIDCPNSDICVSAFAKKRGIALTVCGHRSDYLRNLMPMAPNAPSIFGKYSKNDKVLTDYVNANL